MMVGVTLSQEVLARPRGVGAPPGPLTLQFHTTKGHAFCVRLYAVSTRASTRTQQVHPSLGHPRSTVVSVGRKVDLDDLVDATEIARRLNVKRPQVVHDWRRRHSEFPEPVTFLGNSHGGRGPGAKGWAGSPGRAA